MEKLTCYFLDRNDHLLFIRDDASKFVVNEADYELECSFPIDNEKKISEGMKIGFRDIDDDLQFYDVIQPEENPLDMTVTILAEHSAMAELLDEDIIDADLKNATTAAAVAAALSGARWTPRNITVTNTETVRLWYVSRWAALNTISETWDATIKFAWTINDSGISGRYVDLYPAANTRRGKRFESGKDISALLVKYDDSNIATAIIGRGSDLETDAENEQQDTEHTPRVSFRDVVWSKANGDPADKPAGQEWVEDVEATALYGRNGRARMKIVDLDGCSDPNELLTLTWQILQRINRPAISIKCTVADLERLYGYAHEAVRKGDMVAVIADQTNTEIETTVDNVHRDYVSPENTVVYLGNHITETADLVIDEIKRSIKAENKLASKITGTQMALGAESSRAQQAEQELKLEFMGAQSAIYSTLYMNDEILRIEFMNGISGLYSQISVSAEELRSEFYAEDSQIYSTISQTARELKTEFGNSVSGLYSSISQTAERLQSEFSAAESSIYSTVTQTAQELSAEFGNSLSGLYFSLSITAGELRTEFSEAESSIYSTMSQTAQELKTEFGNSISNIYSSVSISAAELRTEFHNSESSIYSVISQTEREMKAEFSNSISDMYSSITASAESLRTEFSTAESAIYSSFSQSAQEMRVEFGNSLSGVYSSISASANSVRSEMHAADSSIYSEFLQTLSSITLSANRVYIKGNTTMSDVLEINNDGALLVKTIAIFGDSGNLVTINNGKVSADTIQINSTGSLKFGDGTGYGYRTINSTTAGNLVTGFGTASESNGRIFIPYYTVGIPSGSGGSAGNINFNIASTQTYRDGVEARSAHSLSSVTLTNADTGSAVQKTVTVFSLDDEEIDLPITINANAVYLKGKADGAGEVVQRNATGLSRVTLSSSDTGSSVSKTVTVFYDDDDEEDLPITINASAVYAAGYSGCHLSETWGSGNESNKVVIGKTTSGSANSLTFTITSESSISYNTSTHTYTASGKAKVNGTQKDSSSAISGTEAYDAGHTAGKNATTISKSGWNSYSGSTVPAGRTLTLTTDAPTPKTLSVPLTLSASGLTVQLLDGSTVVAQTTTQPLLQTKTATSNGTVTADSGYNGLSSVTVNVSQTPTFAWKTSSKTNQFVVNLDNVTSSLTGTLQPNGSDGVEMVSGNGTYADLSLNIKLQGRKSTASSYSDLSSQTPISLGFGETYYIRASWDGKNGARSAINTTISAPTAPTVSISGSWNATGLNNVGYENTYHIKNNGSEVATKAIYLSSYGNATIVAREDSASGAVVAKIDSKYNDGWNACVGNIYIRGGKVVNNSVPSWTLSNGGTKYLSAADDYYRVEIRYKDSSGNWQSGGDIDIGHAFILAGRCQWRYYDEGSERWINYNGGNVSALYYINA